MSVPGILTGGENLWLRPDGEPTSGLGQYGNYPGATPKYAINNGPRARAEYKESMARLFIEIPPARRARFYRTLPEEVRDVAKPLLESSYGYIDFLLTNTQEAYQEKEQIVETLADTYVAYYTGHAAPVFQYQGTLLNTFQDDQRVWFHHLYNHVLRGNKLAARGITAKLRYDSFIVTGYMNMMGMNLQGGQETASQFNFAMRVKRVETFASQHSLPNFGNNDETSRADIETPGVEDRAAAESSEFPPTAEIMPGGAVSTSLESVRRRAEAAGLSGPALDSVVFSATEAYRTTFGSDQREYTYIADSNGDVRFPDPEPATDPNPNNFNEDGEGGATNVYGGG